MYNKEIIITNIDDVINKDFIVGTHKKIAEVLDFIYIGFNETNIEIKEQIKIDNWQTIDPNYWKSKNVKLGYYMPQNPSKVAKFNYGSVYYLINGKYYTHTGFRKITNFDYRKNCVSLLFDKLLNLFDINLNISTIKNDNKYASYQIIINDYFGNINLDSKDEQFNNLVENKKQTKITILNSDINSVYFYIINYILNNYEKRTNIL